MRARSMTVVLVFAGCSGASNPGAGSAGATQETGSAVSKDAAAIARPAVVTDEMVSLMDRVVASMVRLGVDLEPAAGDCKQATAVIQAAAAEVKTLGSDVDKLPALAGDPTVRSWFETTYGSRIIPVMKQLGELAQACRGDPELGAALTTHPLLKKQQP